MRSLRLAGVFGALALTSCIDTGAERFALPYSVVGEAPSEIAGRDGWTVTLDEARLAFGPLYLCQAIQPGDYCEIAVAESLAVHEIDALDPAEREVGSVAATANSVRSYMAELGYTYPLTARAPEALAPELLGGHSLVLHGEARHPDGRVLRFAADLVIAPNEVDVVPVQRDLDVEHALAPGDRMLLHFAPSTWIASVDFDALHDPAAAMTQDVVVEEGTQAFRALRLALVANATPEMVFTR